MQAGHLRLWCAFSWYPVAATALATSSRQHSCYDNNYNNNNNYYSSNTAAITTTAATFVADMEFSIALTTVLRRIAKSIAFRQLVVIGVAILLVRYCLNGALKALAAVSGSRVEWDKTKLYYILREVRGRGIKWD